LDLDCRSPSAAERWKHWLKIFDNYLEDARERMPRPADGAEQPLHNKLRMLINFVSAEIHKLVEDCTSYDAAKAKLEETFNKTPNAIYALYQLTTGKQEVGASLEDFLLSLHRLRKIVNCKT